MMYWIASSIFFQQNYANRAILLQGPLLLAPCMHAMGDLPQYFGVRQSIKNRSDEAQDKFIVQFYVVCDGDAKRERDICTLRLRCSGPIWKNRES